MFIINLPECTGRLKRIEGQINQLNITSDHTIVEAVHGKHWQKQTQDPIRADQQVEHEIWTCNQATVKVCTKKNLKQRSCIQSFLPGHSPNEIGCSLAHLKAIRLAYQSLMNRENANQQTTMVNQCALIMEDDTSFEFCSKWGDNNGLAELIQDLNQDDAQWAVCQLTLCLGYLEGGVVLEKNIQYYQENKRIRLRDPFDDVDAFCAAAYLVSRSGMEEILANCWPDGLQGALHGPEWSDLIQHGHGGNGRADDGKDNTVKFDLTCSRSMGSVADMLMFAICEKTYLATRPLFTYNDNGISNLNSDDTLAVNSKSLIHDHFYKEAATKSGDQPATPFIAYVNAIGKELMYVA